MKGKGNWSTSFLKNQTFAVDVLVAIMRGILLWSAGLTAQKSRMTFIYFQAVCGHFINVIRRLCIINSKGLMNPKCIGVIGSGVVIHIPSLFQEIDKLQEKGTCIQNRAV